MPTPKKHRKVLRDNIQGITSPALKRILHRAGVKRINTIVYEELRGRLLNFARVTISKVIIFTQHVHRRTVSVKDLECALDIMGISLAAGHNANAKKTVTLQSCNSRGKTSAVSKGGRKKKPGEMVTRDIRYQQKNSDCLAIPKLNFERLVREVGQDFETDLRYSPGFFDLFQLVCEDYLYHMCVFAYSIAVAAGRETLTGKDLHLAVSIATG